ncbi:ABC transporter permease [Sunxiuqinia sp. A32]|uniref:ABC transporter permease n=1 Tax=Sunxiuqinia sp. A32 TaxID=3461496 RepID=UPI0040462654
MGINLLGLIIAFSVSSLIMLYVINELKYDAGHKNAKHIYRIINNIESTGTTDALTTLDLGPLIQENIPEVEDMTRLTNAKSWVIINGEEIKSKSIFVDPGFVEMFTLKSKEKQTASLLEDPNSVLITEDLAQRIFGNAYPVGKEIKIKFPKGEYFFQVKGIIDNFSNFSSVNGDLLLNFQFFHKNLCSAFIESYPYFTTFLMIKPSANIAFVEDKINKANIEEWTGISTSKYELQKYSQMYLHSDYLSNNFFKKGNARIVYGLMFLIVLVVLTACLNFGILSTACALSRNKEIGVRKINGASTNQVKKQLMFESYFLAVIALPVSLFIAKALLPFFNNFFNRKLEFNFLENFPFILSMLGLVVLTASVSGIFTSFSTSQITPIRLLKKENTKLKLGINLNKVLLTGQMLIVIWFLALAFLIFKQINFAQKKGLGYNPENLIVCSAVNPNWKGGFENPDIENFNKLEDLIARIKEHPSIKDVTLLYETPPLGDQLGSGVIQLKETHETYRIATIGGIANFPEMLGYRLKEGGFLTENYSGDAKNNILLNEAAVKYLGLKNPVGTQISMDGAENAKIVGVVYDFNFQSMRKEIVPVRIRKTNRFLRSFDVVVRYLPGSENEALSHLNSSFSQLYRGYETELVFHEEKMKALYEKEINEARVITLGIVLAVFISIMGIFGISLFSIRQQVKEIGIRKINGAKIQSILYLINLNIVKWVGLAFVIATPLAWLSMNKWLENFAYRTTLSWWVFAIAGLLALGIALLTVSFQSWKAATRNPVEALRYE